MGALKKFEIYAEQTAAELDDARSKFSVEAASIEVVKDAMAFFKTKRKRKRKGGGRPEVHEVCCNGIRNKAYKGCNVDRGQYSMMRVSAMLSMMASSAKKTNIKPTDAQRLSVALQKLRSLASVVDVRQ
jgi:hypothetical protein